MPDSRSAAATITSWLREWRSGNAAVLPKLTAAVYEELRRLAILAFRDERSEALIQPTALVHELYLQLPDVRELDWQSRGQFYAVASRMMRNILVDHARKRRALKRGGAGEIVLPAPDSHTFSIDLSVISVHEALDAFTSEYPRQSRVVELRFFGGLTVEETLEALRAEGVDSSHRTVERDWTFARAWLHRAITTG